MFNLFRQPIEKSSFESWAKIADDIAKVAILAVPVMLYGKDPFWVKLLNTSLLTIAVYLFLIGGKLFRKKAEEYT
ncbi:hypothetical protein A4G19_14030 [Pasteurellaceae bacterium Macca]|nr:hypothetical protein [Pasteurellaceae bacterium Macca]MCK3656795.1 hypothetical protein [Pasteurellaceae bacterium Macca]